MERHGSESADHVGFTGAPSRAETHSTAKRNERAEAREGDESRINAGAEEGELVVEDEGSKT